MDATGVSDLYGIKPILDVFDALGKRYAVEQTGGGCDWLVVEIQPDRILALGWIEPTKNLRESSDIGSYVLRPRNREVSVGDLVAGVAYKVEPWEEGIPSIYEALDDGVMVGPVRIPDKGFEVGIGFLLTLLSHIPMS